LVAMPPPTEQGFQPRYHGERGRGDRRNAPSNRTRISTDRARAPWRSTESQCPLQQNKDFNLQKTGQTLPMSRRNAPSNRTRISTSTDRSICGRRTSQCPLQQNKDFNTSTTAAVTLPLCRNAPSNRTRISTPTSAVRAAAGAVAMPPPTEQGFQRSTRLRSLRRRRSQCPLQQNKDFNEVPKTTYPEYWVSQCPLQQNKDFNWALREFSDQARRRNAPSNRTRISTSVGRSTGISGGSQCPLQQNKDFNVPAGTVETDTAGGRNAPSNRTRISTGRPGRTTPG